MILQQPTDKMLITLQGLILLFAIGLTFYIIDILAKGLPIENTSQLTGMAKAILSCLLVLCCLFIIIMRRKTILHKGIEKLSGENSALEHPVEEKSNHLVAENLSILQAFSRITDGVMALDKDWRYIYVNRVIGKQIHRDPAMLVGKNFWDEFPAEVGSVKYKIFHQVMARQAYESVEDYCAELNIWQEHHIYPSPRGIFVFTTNITEKKKAAQHTQEINLRFRDIINATCDVTWDWDLVSGKLTWSEGLQRNFGYNSKNGQQNLAAWPDHIHPDDAERIVKSVSKTIEGKINSWTEEYRFKKADGSYTNVSARGIVIRNESETGLRLTGGIVDISGRKEKEERMKLLESVITNTSDAVMITAYEPLDEPGPKILYVNEAFTKMTGYSSAEITGKTPRILQGPETNFTELKKMSETIRKGLPYETNIINYKKNGEKFWMHFSVNPVINENGAFTHWIAIERDMTESKTAESELQEAYLERNAILESIGDGFFAVNNDWIVTYWNKEAERILNKSKHEMVGQNLWELFPDAVNTLSYQHYQQALQEKTNKNFQVFYEKINKWFETSAYWSLGGLLVYFKDITASKKSEIELTKLNEQLEKRAKELDISNAELEQFAFIASHDLQEPLRMITSFLAQLEKRYGSAIDDKGKQYIAFAVDGAKRMQQIILDLLEFSKIGLSESLVEEIDPNEIVNDILSLYRRQIQRKKVVIKIEKLPTLITHKTALFHVFQNLISNSLKYIRAGSDAPEINITGRSRALDWEFAVEDNGIGIDPQYFDKIFIIFQRLHSKEEYTGTGMGLAITKKIIEKIGGQIRVESKEQHGSTFYFTIPK